MDKLPPETRFKILEYLAKEDLNSVCLLSREWYTLATDPHFLRAKRLGRIRYSECPRFIPYHPLHLVQFMPMYFGFTRDATAKVDMYSRLWPGMVPHMGQMIYLMFLWFSLTIVALPVSVATMNIQMFISALFFPVACYLFSMYSAKPQLSFIFSCLCLVGFTTLTDLLSHSFTRNPRLGAYAFILLNLTRIVEGMVSMLIFHKPFVTRPLERVAILYGVPQGFAAVTNFFSSTSLQNCSTPTLLYFILFLLAFHFIWIFSISPRYPRDNRFGIWLLKLAFGFACFILHGGILSTTQPTFFLTFFMTTSVAIHGLLQICCLAMMFHCVIFLIWREFLADATPTIHHFTCIVLTVLYCGQLLVAGLSLVLLK